MAKGFRFGEYQKEVTLYHNEISYNKITPNVSKTSKHKSAHEKVQLRTTDIYRLLAPYVGTRFREQLMAVVPLAAYMGLFQFFVLQKTVQDATILGLGLFAAMVGLMLFMEGLKLGLMPFGETIGNTLPKKTSLPVVLIIAFLLGVGVTFAEPAIGALQEAGKNVDPLKAPYLYSLLTTYSFSLVLVVGAGVGLAAVLGTIRFIYGWSLKPYIYASLLPVAALTLYAQFDPELIKVIGLAWDCGAVTTGPVTVPLVLSLGIGVASAVGQGNSALSGFGIVTLASLFPILGVLILSIVIAQTVPVESILAAAAEAQSLKNAATLIPWYETTPYVEAIGGIRAIVPLVLFLMFIQKFILKDKLKEAGTVQYGITLCVLGMIVFGIGLTYGLSNLGNQSGEVIPGAFMPISGLEASPLYSYTIGVGWALFFAWMLGLLATMAEPALNALGITVETLTNGAFKKRLLMYSVSIGVAVGIAVGVSKLIFGWQLAYLLIPGYFLAAFITYLSSEEYVNIAWDSAGVTTGPVTVPLVLAMGLGMGGATGAIEGFGVLSCASLFPVLAVLSCGLYVQWQSKQEKSEDLDDQNKNKEVAA